MKAKAKKILNIFFIIAILVSQFSYPIWTIEVSAQEIETTVATKYFYDQLKEKNEQVFYSTMEVMLEKGFFKMGNASIEVFGLDVSKSEQSLLANMGAARDAFMLDYPELFYVDFDYLSMRVTTDALGKHVYLGTGRGDNYINKEFLDKNGNVDTKKIDDAIKTVNDRIDAITKKAEGKSVREQIKLAHDEVIKAAAYKLEYQTEHPYSVRTIYGVFGLGNGANKGNAVCEGYARALKAILDRLGIPAILVRGAYMNKGYQQEHMWVYVKLEGENYWYAIDPTFDNSSEDENGTISYDYFMADAVKMSEHVPIGIISTSNFIFDYPVLNGGVTENKNDYSGVDQTKIVYKDANGLLVIDAGKEEIDGKEVARVFHISYNGKGYNKAIKEDKVYIITNSWQEKDNMETGGVDIIPSEWQYPSDIGDYQMIYQDYDNYLSMRVDNITALQVGITNIVPEEPTEANYYDVIYKGGDEGIIARSTDIESGVGRIDYAQPFPVKTTPAQTVAQTVGKTYHIEVTYDQDLIFEDGNTDKVIGTDLKIYDTVYGYREPDPDYMKFDISKPVLVNNRTIAFDLTPSKLWSMDKVEYIVQFTGIVGSLSHKEPFPVIYGATNLTTGCIYALRAMGIDMEAYGKPTLMDDFDLEDILPEDFNIDDEILQKYGDLLKHRLSLVVTNTQDDVQEKKMEDALLKELGNRSLDTTEGKTNVEMYNISLGLCTEQLKKLKDGTKLKVMLGFPLGYGPEDKGVTFKAYHYNVRADGTYDIEEIECIVTELGLVIYVDSFSPFAIAAVKATAEEEASKDLSITFNVTDGGHVETNNLDGTGTQIAGIVTNYYVDKAKVKHYAESETRTFTVVPDSGYKVESVEKVTIIRDSEGKITSYDYTPVALKDNKFTVKYTDGTNYRAIFIANDTGVVLDANTGAIIDSSEDQTTSNKPSTGDSNNTQTKPNTSNNAQTKPNTSNNAQTSVMDVRFYIVLAVISLVGIIYTKRKKIA